MNKKLFGLFNIVDILIVILVVAVLAGGFFFLKSTKKIGNNANNQTMYYTVMGEKVRTEIKDLPKVGENIYNSSTYAYLGKLKSIEIGDYYEYKYDAAKGQYEKISVEDLCNVYLTIEGEGYEDDKSIFVENTLIKVGEFLNVKGKGYAFSSYVVDISSLELLR